VDDRAISTGPSGTNRTCQLPPQTAAPISVAPAVAAPQVIAPAPIQAVPAPVATTGLSNPTYVDVGAYQGPTTETFTAPVQQLEVVPATTVPNVYGQPNAVTVPLETVPLETEAFSVAPNFVTSDTYVVTPNPVEVIPSN